MTADLRWAGTENDMAQKMTFNAARETKKTNMWYQVSTLPIIH